MKTATEYLIKSKIDNSVTKITTGKNPKKLRREFAADNKFIISAKPVSQITGFYYDELLWEEFNTDTSYFGGIIWNIDDDDCYMILYDSYRKYLDYIYQFREFCIQQKIQNTYSDKYFKIIYIKDLGYKEVPIKAQVLFLFGLGFKIGRYEYEPKNKEGIYNYIIRIRTDV